MAVYSATYPIHTYEADPSGRATFAAIFRFLQDIAAEHAAATGYGLDDLKESSNLWVLSRFLYRAYRTPQWRERLQVDTWPSGTESIFALRDWEVTDERGRRVAEATSSWVVIDSVRRTPVRIERVANRGDMVTGRRLFDRSPAKIEAIDQGEASYETRALYADMDLNGHVNSTRYLEWIFEGLPPAFREGDRVLEEIEVNFSGEGRAGDEIAVYTLPQSADSFLHSVVKKDDDRVLCRARTSFG